MTSENPSSSDVASRVAETLSVEGALAIALVEAAKAGRFDVVAQLAKELEARRLMGGNAVPLSPPSHRGVAR